MGHKFRGLGGLESVKEDRTEWEELDPVERGRSVASEDEDGRPREEEEEVDEDLVEVKRMLKEELTRFSKRNDIGLSSSEQLLRRNEEQAKERRAVDLLEDEEDEEPGNDQGGSTFVEGEQQIEDDGDAHVMFLFTHFVVERSREGMLWSWIVASLGTDEDEFGEEQRETAWRVLTKDVEVDADTEETMVEHPQRGTRSLDVLVERRHTMEPWRIGWRLGESGDHLEGATYLFSSQDGDAYSYYDDMDGVEWCAGSTCWPQLWNGDYFPTNVTDRQKWASCTIDWDVCFDPKIQRAGELFRHVAFGKRECGDCILKALVRASGPLGLSALLPSPERIYHHRRKSGDDGMAKGTVPVGSDHVSPHLPLTTEWRSTDFSLSSVFASGFWDQPHGVRLREWVQRLLEKYRYVLADTDNIFMVIHDPVDAERTFADVDDHPSVPLVTINDDVNESHEKTDRRIREWLGQRWSTPAAWENPDALPVFSPNYDSFYRKRSLDGDHR
ncbi:hypothetical protein FRC17_001079 [Serendipita sp. 399]|nr:hypothetical protein FRC17_001079 [Serendipita sp. 399]